MNRDELLKEALEILLNLSVEDIYVLINSL